MVTEEGCVYFMQWSIILSGVLDYETEQFFEKLFQACTRFDCNGNANSDHTHTTVTI